MSQNGPFKKTNSRDFEEDQQKAQQLYSKNRAHNVQSPANRSGFSVSQAMRNEFQRERQREPTELQFKLDQILKQSAERQQKYINFIKQQQEQIFNKTEKYLDSLKKYKLYIQSKFNQSKQPKKFMIYEKNMGNSYLSERNSRVVNKFNKEEYDLSKCQNYQLHCSLAFIYFTPLLEDYMSEIYPKQIQIKSRIEYPGVDINLECQAVTSDGTDEEILENLINGYPFELINQSRNNPSKGFVLRGDHQITSVLNYFNESQICIDVIDRKTQFVYSRGKLPLKQLLYHSNAKEQSMEKIPFYCIKTNKKIAFLHIQFANQIKIIDKTHTHKVQSETPIEIKGYEFKNKLKNDVQSRIIQRINRFKTNNTSLIPELHTNQNRVDTSLLMHVKMKQLQNIVQFKNSHKEEYMEHILNEALEKYNTQICQLGQCRYLLIRFMNDFNKVRKIIVEATQNKMNGSGKQKIESAENNIWSLVSPQTVKQMIQRSANQVKGFRAYQFQYEFEESERAIWVGAGDTIALCYKFMQVNGDSSAKIQKNNSEQEKQITAEKIRNILNFVYELHIQFTTQYGEKISTEILKVKLREPVPQHTFQLSGYPGQSDQLSIAVPDQSCCKIHSTLRKLQYSWVNNGEFLTVKVKHPSILMQRNSIQKVQYLFLYDQKFVSRKCCFKIVMTTYPEIKVRAIVIGEVGMFQLEMRGVDLIKNFERVANLKKNQFPPESFRVRISTDRGHEAVAQWHGSNQLITKKDETYLIDVRVQTFKPLNPFKVRINCIDIDSQKVLKQFLLKIPIQFPQYRNQFKIYLTPENPKTPYKFELSNLKSSQSEFRMYASNKSILKTPKSLIKLFGNQVFDVQINFEPEKRGNNTFLITDQQLFVILSVTDGSDIWNYLFEIQGLK